MTEDNSTGIPTPETPNQSYQPQFQTSPPESKQGVSGSKLALQWLTYLAWGFFALDLIYLSFTAIDYLILKKITFGDGGESVYYISATIILFIFASVCNYFYSKRESLEKKGGEASIAVVFTVIFSLFEAGSFITLIFLILSSIITSDPNTTGDLSLIYSAILSMIIYAILILRIAMPHRIKSISMYSSIIMGILALIFVIVTIAGPFSRFIATKHDRMLINSLTDIKGSISNYTSTNKHLPQKLNDLSSKSDTVQYVIKNNLVTYQIESANQIDSPHSRTTTQSSSFKLPYKLCVNFTNHMNELENQNRSSYIDDTTSSDNKLISSSYNSFLPHTPGKRCFNLTASYYDNYPVNTY